MPTPERIIPEFDAADLDLFRAIAARGEGRAYAVFYLMPAMQTLVRNRLRPGPAPPAEQDRALRAARASAHYGARNTAPPASRRPSGC